MKLSGRVFFLRLLLSKPATVTLPKVEVLETFDLDGKSVALLVHHARYRLCGVGEEVTCPTRWYFDLRFLRG